MITFSATGDRVFILEAFAEQLAKATGELTVTVRIEEKGDPEEWSDEPTVVEGRPRDTPTH